MESQWRIAGDTFFVFDPDHQLADMLAQAGPPFLRQCPVRRIDAGRLDKVTDPLWPAIVHLFFIWHVLSSSEAPKTYSHA